MSRLAAALLIPQAALLGCGSSESGQVQGRVLRSEGAPLTGARVIARSDATGKMAMGSTDAEGHFQLRTAENEDDLPAGQYAVIIMEGKDELGMQPKPTISPKYSDPSQSGLTIQVAAGEQTNFEAKLDPP